MGKPPLPPLKMEEVKSVAAQETVSETAENDISQPEEPEHLEDIPVDKAEKEPQELKYDLVFFLGVLLKAQKAEKTITEEKIFPQLPDCAYEEKNRKFYLALKDAKISVLPRISSSSAQMRSQNPRSMTRYLTVNCIFS